MMKLTAEIRHILESESEYNGIKFNVIKKGNSYFSEIDGDIINSSKGKSESEAIKNTKEYIDSTLK